MLHLDFKRLLLKMTLLSFYAKDATPAPPALTPSPPLPRPPPRQGPISPPQIDCTVNGLQPAYLLIAFSFQVGIIMSNGVMASPKAS